MSNQVSLFQRNLAAQNYPAISSDVPKAFPLYGVIRDVCNCLAIGQGDGFRFAELKGRVDDFTRIRQDFANYRNTIRKNQIILTIATILTCALVAGIVLGMVLTPYGFAIGMAALGIFILAGVIIGARIGDCKAGPGLLLFFVIFSLLFPITLPLGLHFGKKHLENSFNQKLVQGRDDIKRFKEFFVAHQEQLRNELEARIHVLKVAQSSLDLKNEEGIHQHKILIDAYGNAQEELEAILKS